MIKSSNEKTPTFLRKPITKAYDQLTDKVVEVC